MTAIDRICDELRELGFNPEKVRLASDSIELAVFEYAVEVGRYAGRQFQVGLRFQEEGYPEYPPHWVYVANLPAGFTPQAAPIHSSVEHGGVTWSAFSVPPGDFWDRLPSGEKNMKTYIQRHFIRFWSQV